MSSRTLGKYCWAAWESVILRACCNWSLVRRVIVGCVFCVWYLVRRTMGWTSGEVSLGFTFVDGAGTCWCIILLGAGSHRDILSGTLGSGWWVMSGCFNFLSRIFISRLVWAGVGLVIGISGSGISLGVSQLLEASRRAEMACHWESDWAVGASVRAYFIVVIPWRMRSSGVTNRIVMVWLRNSTVSEICPALVFCGITRWHR